MAINPARILLVENDALLGETLKALFEGNGYIVSYFAEGQKALDDAAATNYSLALIDIYLGDISGLDILDYLRSETRHAQLPILMMTADATEDTAVLALAKDADEVILKPIRHQELLLKIKQWLDRFEERLKLKRSNETFEAQSAILSQYFCKSDIESLQMLGATITPSTSEATALFLHIENLYPAYGGLPPLNIEALLGELFTEITQTIFAHEGAIQHTIADISLAAFGAPLTHENDTLNAVHCALALKERLATFFAARPSPNNQPVSVSIGVSTGTLFSSTVKTPQNFKFIVFGQAVTDARRIERHNKKIASQILVDKTTFEKTQSRFEYQKVRLRDKNHEIEVYSLLKTTQP